MKLKIKHNLERDANQTMVSSIKMRLSAFTSLNRTYSLPPIMRKMIIATFLAVSIALAAGMLVMPAMEKVLANPTKDHGQLVCC